jgi:hypothetical protein
VLSWPLQRLLGVGRRVDAGDDPVLDHFDPWFSNLCRTR